MKITEKSISAMLSENSILHRKEWIAYSHFLKIFKKSLNKLGKECFYVIPIVL